MASRGSSLSSPQPEKDKRKKQRISLPFLPQRLSSPIPDESVSNLGSSLLDLSTPSRPTEVWANMSRVGSVLDEKQTVNYVTTHYLFPKCKFSTITVTWNTASIQSPFVNMSLTNAM